MKNTIKKFADLILPFDGDNNHGNDRNNGNDGDAAAPAVPA